jgi:ribosomal protein S18 acetylase RimI-like enzyme
MDHIDVLGIRTGEATPSVRRAAPGDAAAVADIQRRCWQRSYGHLAPAPDSGDTADQWRAALATGETLAWVACTGGTVVGVALADTTPEEVAAARDARDGSTQPASAELVVLDVDPSAQRVGHGSRLLTAVADHLRAGGVALLHTWVLLDDVPRVRFLKSAGFAPDGARRTLADEQGNEVRLTRLATRLTDDT